MQLQSAGESLLHLRSLPKAQGSLCFCGLVLAACCIVSACLHVAVFAASRSARGARVKDEPVQQNVSSLPDTDMDAADAAAGVLSDSEQDDDGTARVPRLPRSSKFSRVAALAEATPSELVQMQNMHLRARLADALSGVCGCMTDSLWWLAAEYFRFVYAGCQV